MTTLDPKERFGYVCEENSEDLHRLVISPDLEAALVPGSCDVVHVNVEFADQAGGHGSAEAPFLVSA